MGRLKAKKEQERVKKSANHAVFPFSSAGRKNDRAEDIQGKPPRQAGANHAWLTTEQGLLSGL